jgi:hypothetical protein
MVMAIGLGKKNENLILKILRKFSLFITNQNHEQQKLDVSVVQRLDE